MNTTIVRELYEQIDALPIIDVHTHVDWQKGSAKNIGQILSYHYYTELVNSAGLREVEYPYDDPEALFQIIMPRLGMIRNTVQYDWLMTISREFLFLDPEEWVPEHARFIFQHSTDIMGQADWTQQLIAQCNISRVFLTNEYDADLEGLDQGLYTPCLRTESFVVGMLEAQEREDMGQFLGRPIRTTADVDAAIAKAFDRFLAHGMGYAAISTLGNLSTYRVEDAKAQALLDRLVAGSQLLAKDREDWMAFAMDRVAQACRRHNKPYHLMVGVDRNVYEQGVPSGRDLFDSSNSMRGYDYLFNAYPDVSFPTSVLSDTTGLELTAAAWIRHNVYPSGHWWYANQPTDISREVTRRLDVVPHNKIIGYYSDAYYLEFILPKFRMYKFELANALAERMERSLIHPNMEPFTLDQALELAYELLVANPTEILRIDA